MRLPAPVHSFASGNVAGAHPAVLEAIAAANTGTAAPYGADPWTARAVGRVRELFGAPAAEVLFTYGGTGANVVALQSVLEPYEAVICPATAHINTDECGATERFTGAKLLDVVTPDGKLTPDLIAPLLDPARGEHNVRPAVVAISQVTELGTVYTLDEIAALAELAHAHGLVLFVDGARLSNAAARLGCSPAQLATHAGVDLLTLGGTKNGLLYGDAVVLLRPDLARRARYARKQAGQLASKMRFIAAQFDALLAGDLWLNNARHANTMAAKLAAALGHVPAADVLHAPQANSVFVRVPSWSIAPLQDWSFFWTWDSSASTVRWMTSFATTDDDVSRFAAGVEHLTDPAAHSHPKADAGEVAGAQKAHS
jgi:threonine aldolase